MQLNTMCYSNGFQREQGKRRCARMGAVLSGSSAPQEVHFSFGSYAVSQEVCVRSGPCVVRWGGFQPPQPEAGE